MIITCPNCQTRYQLAEKAIGSAGRKVLCAHCQKSWNAVPEKEQPLPKPKLVAEQEAPVHRRKNEDEIFTAEDEAALDAEFAAADVVQTPEAPSVPPSDDTDASVEDVAEDESAKNPDSKNYRAMLRRQALLRKQLPTGRIRFHARVLIAGLLGVTIVGGLMFRTDIVRLLPDMAGVYSAIGLPVNVNGLEFTGVETLRSMQNGVDVMLVTGRVHNISGKQAGVPPIVVSILDEQGNSVYSWSVMPLARVLGPNEKIEFEARLNSAPAGAQAIRLGFAEESTSQKN